MKAKNKLKTLNFALYVVLGILLLGLSYLRVFDDFEHSTLDLRYSLRPVESVDKDIVIIEVGDDSIEKLGKWPFPRNYHSMMIKALNSAGVKTIMFDIFFSEAKEGDQDLADTAKEAGNVYMPYIFEPDRSSKVRSRVSATGYAAPLIDVLKTSVKGAGFINVEPDPDGKVRRIPPVIFYEGKYYPHLTVLIALDRLGYKFDDVKVVPGNRIEAGKLVIPLDEDSSMMVNYPAKWGKTFRHYSYVDIIQSYLAGITGKEATLDLKELKGATCFIGLTATASPDAHPSPTEALYPGIGVHTSVYNSILSGHFLRRLDRGWNMLILAVLSLFMGAITSTVKKRFAMLSVVCVMAAYFFIAMIFFWPFGIWIDVFYPLAAAGVIYVVLTFRRYVVETQKREVLEKELDIAKDIQLSFLPKEIPLIGGLDISASMFTAKQVGGDLYDVVKLDDDRLGIMMGDVSGKGVPAALYMARVVSVFKTYVREGSPAEVVRKINDRLVEESNTNLFVTLSYMIIDTAAKKLTYSSGGHLPIVMLEPGGNVVLLDTTEGIPLGLLSSDFSENSREYAPGTMFILYTDGVTEAMNQKEAMFDQKRLVEVAARLKTATAKDAVEAVRKSVFDFAGKAPQHDDITILAVRT